MRISGLPSDDSETWDPDAQIGAVGLWRLAQATSWVTMANDSASLTELRDAAGDELPKRQLRRLRRRRL